MQDDIRSSLRTTPLLQDVFWVTFAAPVDRLCTLTIRERLYLDTRRHHEGRVEAQTKVTNDSHLVVLILIEELLCSREGYLIDVLLDLLSSHTDTTVTDSDRLSISIEANGDLQVTQLTLELACRGQCTQLLRSIYGIGYQLTKENIMFTVEELLDDGEDVLTRHPNLTLLTHRVYSLSCMMDIRVSAFPYSKRMPHLYSTPIWQALPHKRIDMQIMCRGHSVICA